MRYLLLMVRPFSFNTQPPEGGWLNPSFLKPSPRDVSTHSRLKAAGKSFAIMRAPSWQVSTHSRLKAAGVIIITASHH